MGRITVDQDKWNQLLRLVHELGTDTEVISDIVVTAPPAPEPLFTGKAKLAWGAKVSETYRCSRLNEWVTVPGRISTTEATPAASGDCTAIVVL